MTTKEQLVAEITRSRAAIARDFAEIRAELNFAGKIKKSVKSRPFAWLSGAAAIGYILAGPKSRTKTVTKIVKDKNHAPAKTEKKIHGGLFAILLAAFKFAIPLLRPALTAYAARQVDAFASHTKTRRHKE